MNFGGPIKNAPKAINRQKKKKKIKQKLAKIISNIFLQKDEFDLESDDRDNKIIEVVIGIKIVNASTLIKVAKNPKKIAKIPQVIHEDEKICITRRF